MMLLAEDIFVHDIILKLWQKKPEIDFSNEDNPYLFSYWFGMHGYWIFSNHNKSSWKKLFRL